MYIILKLKYINKIKRYFRYIKLVVNFKSVALIVIISIFSNGITLFQNYKYDYLYENLEDIMGKGIIVSNEKEKKYTYQYKIKVLSVNSDNRFNGTYLFLNVNKKQNKKLELGDEVNFSGKFIKPTTRTNYGGFDYKQYLKTIKVFGTVDKGNIKIISKNRVNFIFTLSNKCLLRIEEIIESNFNEENSQLLKGILLGENSNIEDNVKDNFRNSNISHILAVSGMHIAYIVMGINLILKLIVGKNKLKVIIIIVLIFYMFITGFSPSVIRACSMEILVLLAGLIHRKEDTITSLSFSLLLILFYNPFLIMNIGLQFSYVGTIGILYFNKNVLKILKEIKIKNRKWRYKINGIVRKIVDQIKEILAVTISVQLGVLPISIYHFNMFTSYFFITNLLVSIIIGPIIILGIITILANILSLPISIIFSKILKTLVQILMLISKIGNLPFSKIYIKTPSIYKIIIYYILIIFLNFCYEIYNYKNINNSKRRIRNLIALAKYRFMQNKKRYKLIIIIIIIIFLVLKVIPQKLEIHFIDVGQGDSTFIITPFRRTILIDGGGSSSNEFNVGENVLIPYILDRGYTKIDYVFISHFDQDHVGGILQLLQEIKVKNVIIGKQFENSENYQNFLNIVKERKIKVIQLCAGSRVNVENKLYFDILWPERSQIISENSINNNALVCKLNYKKFSMLFTGDIEEATEKILVSKYGNTNILKSTVLKVAHHGSKSSSIEEFLQLVKPITALIGVGENNRYGHPNEEVINRLKKLNCKIYRTDLNGEISFLI